MFYRNIKQTGDEISGEESWNKRDWYRFVADESLMKIQMYWTDRRIWSLQDGYGTPGYTPTQRMDWSGVRDSSPQAIAKMLKVAEKLHNDKPWPWRTRT